VGDDPAAELERQAKNAQLDCYLEYLDSQQESLTPQQQYDRQRWAQGLVNALIEAG
jgi:ribosome assembly protein YihI (activator of Der GTPase)